MPNIASGLPKPKPNNCSLPFCPSSSSPQARNDFELRRLMELDPAFAGSAGPEEARRKNYVYSYGVYSIAIVPVIREAFFPPLRGCVSVRPMKVIQGNLLNGSPVLSKTLWF